MLTWLLDYGIRLFDVLLILIAIVALAGAGYWLLHRRWQAERRQLQSDLAETRQRNDQLQHDWDEERARYDLARIKALHDHFQRVIAHEFGKGLKFIANQSEEALSGLREDQLDLRDGQAGIAAKAYEMLQHAANIVGMADLTQNAPKQELVKLRGLLEGVLKELVPYAAAQDVHLQPKYGVMEPILVNRLLIVQLYSNVIHNAIKYSPRGSVVYITLYLEGTGTRQAVIEVSDHGRGIAEQDRERIFQLHVRGDGLVAPGSGLGLYYARQIARLHGGDLVLVESKLNEGSTFKIILPYT